MSWGWIVFLVVGYFILWAATSIIWGIGHTDDYDNLVIGLFWPLTLLLFICFSIAHLLIKLAKILKIY